MKTSLIFVIILAIVSTSVFGASRKSKNPPVYRVVSTAEQLAEAKKDPTLTKVVLDTNLAVFPSAPAESPQWSTNTIEFDGTNRVIRISSPRGEKLVVAPRGFWDSQKTSESAQVARAEVPQQPQVVYVVERPTRSTSWWNRPMRSYHGSYGYSGGYGGGMYAERVRTSGNYNWNTGSYSGIHIGSGYGYQGSPASYVIQPGQTYGERVGPYYGPAEVLIHQDNVYTLSGGIGGSTYR